MDLAEHDINERSQSALVALKAQTKELQRISDDGYEVLAFGIEELDRWDARTESVIRKEVGPKEAERFQRVISHTRPRNIAFTRDMTQATLARKVYLVSVIEEVRDYPQAVFERETKPVPATVPANSITLSATQLQARIVTALTYTRMTRQTNAESKARIVVRVVFGIVLFVLLSTIVLRGGFVVARWDRIEPYAWMASVAIVVLGVFYGSRVPVAGKWLQQVVSDWYVGRANRIIDLDTIEKLIKDVGDEDD